MQSPVTISIGIPAHNEELNITQLIRSIATQEKNSFTVEKVMIICDGCTDNTARVAKQYATENKLKYVVVIDDGGRTGKAKRLNQMYDLNNSDFLVTMDADVVFKKKNDLELLVRAMIDNPEILVAGPRYEPVKTNTLMGKFAEYSYLFFEDAIFQLNNGNNIYALMGCASIIRKSLTKSFHFADSVISDQNFLYLIAKKERESSFLLVKDASVLFRTVTTFQDWRILSSRSVVGDKASVQEHFGEETLKKEYFMPRQYLVKALIKWFFKNPFYMTGALFMNFYIRLFPYKARPIKNGIWETTASSKTAINT